MEGVHSGEWENLTSGGSAQGADTATLMFTSIESCSEGLYRCVVTNIVGEKISEYTDHIIGEYQLSYNNNSAVVHTNLIQRHLVKQHNCNIATYSPFMQVKLQSHVIFLMSWTQSASGTSWASTWDFVHQL